MKLQYFALLVAGGIGFSQTSTPISIDGVNSRFSARVIDGQGYIPAAILREVGCNVVFKDGEIAITQNTRGSSLLLLNESLSMSQILSGGLQDFNYPVVLVESLKSPLTDQLSAGEVGTWITKRLENIGITVTPRGMNIVPVRTSTTTELELLRANDRFHSKVYVNINSVANGCSIDIQIDRGAFVYPGAFRSATVKNYGMILTGSPTAARVRSGINTLMDEFEKDFNASK